MRSYVILLELIFAISFPWSYTISAKPLNTREAALQENSSNKSSTFSRSADTSTKASLYDSNQEHLSKENSSGQVDISFEVEVDKNSKIAVRRIKSGKSKIVEVSLEEHNDNNTTNAENDDDNLIPQPYDNNETLSEMNSLTNSSSFTEFNDTDSIRIKDFEPEVELRGEDLKIQEEWGGNCTVKHWDKCKVVKSWFGDYKDDEGQWKKFKKHECEKEPVVCMRNGWTVNRCHLLCMGYCNKDMQANYDKYVSHDGVCN